ncbi:MAG: hypothetical protein Q9207_007029 [Kuettlingeria erythrocarpa]
MEDEYMEDIDKLQRDSADIIQDLEISISLFLYRDESASQRRLRKRVKRSNTSKLEALFNTFQEWPQLLDATLRRHVEPLISAFKEYIESYSSHYLRSQLSSRNTDSIEPLPRAICKLLYTLCKVRGAKVISIFFTNEPSFLEPLLDAIESWDVANALSWEEKYVMLLWLSHLAQTPFDLASISSSGSNTAPSTPIDSRLIIGLPSVASRMLALGLRYLVSASKEHQAARALLVRLCMRPDMNRLGVKKSCVDWALYSLNGLERGGGYASIYSLTGILSFLAGFINSCDSASASSFLVAVLEYTQDLVASKSSHTKLAYGFATVRKLVIKIHRASAVHLLSGCSLPATNGDDELPLLGTIVDHLMTCLGDKDNLVRFSASKALSVIAQKLDPEMAEQLLDGLAERLQEDVRLTDSDSNDAPLRQDLSTADPLQWHGLILTLSHLLFRHSAPKGKLTVILGLLVHALNFEQRSSTGASTGSGVRDAACFGMWSVARRYTTEELSQVATWPIRSRIYPGIDTSVFRLLASELVLTATLDPEGNIRRAASAALQELIGRHPQKVPYGIDLVQTVDYQAVGLRSRAMITVAAKAAHLDDLYLSAVCNGLLSWRAINSPDAATRRRTADMIGERFRLHGYAPLAPLQQLIESPTIRPLDEWHGIYLAFAAIFPQSPSLFSSSRLVNYYAVSGSKIHLLQKDAPLSDVDISSAGKKGHLAAEALCTAVSALGKTADECMSMISAPRSPSSASQSPRYEPLDDASPTPSHGIATSTVYNTSLETLWYHRTIIEASFEQAATLEPQAYCAASVCLFNQLNDQGQRSLLDDWSRGVIDSSTRYNPEACAARLGAVGSIVQDGLERSQTGPCQPRRFSGAVGNTGRIYDALVSQLDRRSHWIARVAALKWLYAPICLIRLRDDSDTQTLDQALLNCLEDRSVSNSREVGSEVRTQAIETVEAINETAQWDPRQRGEVFSRVYGLAVEKLDKVRDTAWRCIRKFPDAVLPKTHPCFKMMVTEPKRMAELSTSSILYFDFMLSLCDIPLLRDQLIQGLVTSASSGAEDLRTFETIIQVYTGLARYEELQVDAVSALQRLLIHRGFPTVRMAAAAALFVIQPLEQLTTMDLSLPISVSDRSQMQKATPKFTMRDWKPHPTNLSCQYYTDGPYTVIKKTFGYTLIKEIRSTNFKFKVNWETVNCVRATRLSAIRLRDMMVIARFQDVPERNYEALWRGWMLTLENKLGAPVEEVTGLVHLARREWP